MSLKQVFLSFCMPKHEDIHNVHQNYEIRETIYNNIIDITQHNGKVTDLQPGGEEINIMCLLTFCTFPSHQSHQHITTRISMKQ